MKLSEDRLDLIRFGFVAALAMWALCTFSTLIEYMKTGELFAVIKGGKPYVSDFSSYYSAGKIALQAMHTPTNIYDAGLQDRTLKALIAPVAPEAPFFTQLPPPFFLIASILPFFTMAGAWTFWVIAGDIFFFCALHYLLREDIKKRKDFIVLSIAISASFPFWVCDRLGQVALLTVPSAIVFWALLRYGKTIQAGMSCALLLIKFQYLPFLGLVGTARGRLKFVLSSVVSAALAMLASGMVLGMQNVINYPKMFLEGEFKANAYVGVNAIDQQNLRSLLVRQTGEDSSFVNKICMISFLIVALIIFAFWLKAVKNVGEQNRFKFLATLTICTMLFFSPHAHKQDFLLLSVPCSWIWLECIKAEFAGAKWMKRFMISLPFVSWVLFIVDQMHLPFPPFALLLPPIIWASYETFCKVELIKTGDMSAEGLNA